MKAEHLRLRELLALSLMAALIFGSKVALSFLPNIHLGALLLIVATLRFGPKALYTAFVYVMLEGLVYGFGLWWISYLYIWPLLVLAVLPLRRTRSYFVLSVAGALHGLLFGALCAIPVGVLSGLKAGFAYWIAGIPFDLIHGAANFILCLVLLRPLDRLTQKV
ncbi:MAG: hypothetical protein E7464_04420 [Ruminococcaceae bacterium]|nr:hypothetical protein [Oscillospiraceae bacterium]